jgi:elongation factor 1 alpha-like protein
MDEFLPATKLLRENRTRPLRVFVTDVAQAGKNVSVSARVIQGGLRSGGKVLILPVGDVATVRTIEVEGRMAEAVQAGEHAELTLQGVDIARMSIGSVLCKGKAAVPVSRRFVAQITTLPTLGTPILKGTQFQMHMQSLEMPVHATRLVATLKKPLPEGCGGGGGEGGGATVVEAENIKQAKPRCLMGGVLALVEMRCQRPICLERYEDSRALGRFVLRQKGETVAVGMITEILAD